MANGVIVRDPDAKILDIIIGLRYYESEQIGLLEKHARSGDVILDVGAGVGVTTIRAARVAGADGEVLAFEPSAVAIDTIKRAIKDNDPPADINIVQAIVAVEGTFVRDDGRNRSQTISATDLPDGDVLMLDCEGAELEILETIEQRPRVVIVETHGIWDAPAEKVIDRLEHMDYDIADVMGEPGQVAHLAATLEE